MITTRTAFLAMSAIALPSCSSVDPRTHEYAPHHDTHRDEHLSGRLQAILTAHQTNGEFPGAILAVQTSDGQELLLTSGVAAAGDSATPVDADAPWMIGSATKTFVAVVTLQLAEQGRLHLDATIDAWLPQIPRADRITVRQLLQHTSGLADYVDTQAVLVDARRGWSAAELIDVATSREPVCGAGARHHYSNTNYLLLGRLIEAITGEAWHEAVRTRILQTLGMQHTGYAGEAGAPALARGHGLVDGEFVDFTDRWHASLGGAAGGMYSTGADMLRFADALYRGTLLAEHSRAQMERFVPAATEEGAMQDYGLGLQRYSLPDVTMCGHLGSASAHSCFFGYEPGSGVKVAVLVNREFAAPAAFMAAEALAAATQSPQIAVTTKKRPARANAADDAPQSGLHGFLQIQAGFTHRRPDLTQTFGGESTIGSLSDNGGNQSLPLANLNGELSFTFESRATQFYLGGSEIMAADADAPLEVGIRQLLPDGTLLTAAYAPELMAPLGTVWQDPFLTGSARKKVDLTAGGVRIAAEQPLGLPLRFEYQFAYQSVEDERSGSSLGLSDEQRDLLRRDASVQRLRFGAPLPVGDRLTIEPVFELADADAEGAANSFSSLLGGVHFAYAIDDCEVTFDVEYSKARFEREHPVFARTRSDDRLQVSVGLTAQQPFGWQNTSIDWLVSYCRNDSNLSFYDGGDFVYGVGFTYEF